MTMQTKIPAITPATIPPAALPPLLLPPLSPVPPIVGVTIAPPVVWVTTTPPLVLAIGVMMVVDTVPAKVWQRHYIILSYAAI